MSYVAAERAEPCAVCRHPTTQIEVNFEVPLCDPACHRLMVAAYLQAHADAPAAPAASPDPF